MRKGKSRKRRKETRRRNLWIAVAVIGTAAVTAAIFVAGMPATKENAAHGDEMALAGKTKTAGKAEIKASKEDADELIRICIDLYKKAEAENKLADLETIRSMVNRLGENGYPAVDSKNQIDMAQAEQVERFCKMVDAQKRAEVTIIDIDYLGGLVKYDLQTKEGKVEVMRSDYEYKNGTMQRNFIGSYQAENWNYTEEGYLMFSGTYFSEELYALTLSETEEYAALRVQPLDGTCRELTRKYLTPIGFERNNMFIADWSEDDFGELNFYDMYDILCQKENGAYVPHVTGDGLGDGAVYRIPKEEFERVIMTYFNIDHKTLQSKTVYDPGDSAYEYKPRGIDEAEYPEYPYSEVTGFTENSDGTIALTANVVFPYSGNSKVYAHRVVVRPLEDGRVQYVSNKIYPSEDNCEETWHTPRLTAEETKSAEKESEEQWEKGYGLPVDEQEEKEAENDCRAMMERIAHIYKDADKGTASNIVLADETILEMQKKLTETKYPVAATVPYSNMENHESVDAFLADCMEGKSGSAVIYEIHNDGGIGRMKFIFDGTDMYVVKAGSVWNGNGRPGMSYISYTRIKKWKYTDKGWFCYELCVPEPPKVTEIMDGSCLIRIKPMTEEQREMSERCVRGLGYQGNNMLCSNWDAGHMEKLDFNGMYEYLYAMKYGEELNSGDYPNGIPGEEFERLIMEYLPITAGQIREYSAFDEENQTYAWAGPGCLNYAPTFFGTSLPEVTGIKENEDGTVTLTVDAVCDMVICDDAVITHELTVRFAEDGSFQYLGNKILNDGVQDIPDYQYRIPKE